MKQVLRKFLEEEQGLTMVEYAIAGGLVGASVVVAFVNLGDSVGLAIDFVAQLIVAFIPAA